MSIFDIENIFFEIWQYKVSYIELFGVLTGILSVYFASRENILTWPIGIINIICAFFLYFQTQLYPDMFLQLYYFVVTIYGWYFWKSKTNHIVITKSESKMQFLQIIFMFLGTYLFGYFFSNIHSIFPNYFKQPSAFPYSDSFVMVSSVLAMKLMADKKIESWLLWITIDVVCVYLYAQRELYFLTLEYFIFLLLATYGYINWSKQLKIK